MAEKIYKCLNCLETVKDHQIYGRLDLHRMKPSTGPGRYIGDGKACEGRYEEIKAPREQNYEVNNCPVS
jgi:hypothetical protein